MRPQESIPCHAHLDTSCLTRETIRYGRRLALAILFAATLSAQTASIASVPVPTFGAAVFDAAGNSYYIGGGPVTPGAAQTQNGGGTCIANNGFFSIINVCPDAYVGKVNSAGAMVWGTYLGGPTADQSTAVAVDASGNVYLAGTTGGSFPTTADAAIANSTTATAFAAKISADGGTVLYSTYLPSTALTPAAIALDPQGNAYITGRSTTGHAFVLKLSADGSTFAYNVPLAGSKQDAGTVIAADANGNVVVAGQTQSPDFPVSAGVVQTHLAGTQNVFIAGLNAGGAVEFSTYLGGSASETAAAVALDSAGNIYVCGQTASANFPTTAGSFQPAALVPIWNNSSANGFVFRLNAQATALGWSTYVINADIPGQAGTAQLAVAPAGDVYAAGIAGAGFPVTLSAPQICFQGNNTNAYVVHLGSSGALLDATYVGQGGAAITGLAITSGGAVELAWSNGASMVTTLTFNTIPSVPAPCLSPAVLNSATFHVSSTGPAGVAPNEFISLTGFGLGPNTGVAYQPGANGEIPTALAGVQVSFDGVAAPVLYVQSRQINALVPAGVAGEAQTSISVLYNQSTIGSTTVSVGSIGVPGIFRAQPGFSTAAAAANQDGSVNSASNPASIGSIVSVWGTGVGTLSTPCMTGGLNPFSAIGLADGQTVFIQDGQGHYQPLYAGSAPTLACGVEQINLQIPAYATPPVYQFFPWSALESSDGSYDVNTGITGVTIYVK